jgi:hypothetical protein
MALGDGYDLLPQLGVAVRSPLVAQRARAHAQQPDVPRLE